MFISDAKANFVAYKLPKEFVDCLPEYCPTCGSPTEMSDVLTQLHCSNPRCPDKLVIRIKSMCQSMGVLGFGEKTIEDFINYYNVVNPLNIFNLAEGMQISPNMSIEVGNKIIKQISDKKDFLLWEYIQIANLPGIQTSAKAIFGDYDSLEQAYSDIEDGGIQFIQQKLGLTGDTCASIRAIQVYNTLMEFKEDLFECLPDVRIYTLGDMVELNIYCSDQAGGGFKHKKDFYKAIQDEFGDHIKFNIVSSITKKLNYLIWAGADGSVARYTNKVETVSKWQNQGYNIPILTASQFIERMRDLY